MSVIKGVDQILLWRRLKDENKQEAVKLAFQTEHSDDASMDSESRVTKDGAVQKGGSIENDIPFSFLMGRDDPCRVMLEDAFYAGEKMELWIIDRGAEPGEDGKYPAEYRQGIINSWSKTAGAEDMVECSGTFATEMIRQKGFATLSEKQAEAVQYAFRDTTVYESEEATK